MLCTFLYEISDQHFLKSIATQIIFNLSQQLRSLPEAMNRKVQQKVNKLEKIVESSNPQSQIKPVSNIHQKRVSIAAIMNSLQRGEKKIEKPIINEKCEMPTQQQKFEQKDRMIKQLQEQILNKKLKNDMIQQAFQRRHEAEQHLTNFSSAVEILAEGCKILASTSKPFKKIFLRSLITVFKNQGKNRGKATKTLLIWIISWATRLFTFLSSTLIKK